MCALGGGGGGGSDCVHALLICGCRSLPFFIQASCTLLSVTKGKMNPPSPPKNFAMNAATVELQVRHSFPMSS